MHCPALCRKTARKGAKGVKPSASVAAKAPHRSVFSDYDGDAAAVAVEDDCMEEPGTLTLTAKRSKEIRARAAAESAAEAGEATSDDTTSFAADYRALYEQQLLPNAAANAVAVGHGRGGGRTVYSFEVDAEQVDTLKETFMNRLDPPLPSEYFSCSVEPTVTLSLPLYCVTVMVEYDFRADSSDFLPRLDMSLRNRGELRPYQEKCLRYVASECKRAP